MKEKGKSEVRRELKERKISDIILNTVNKPFQVEEMLLVIN